MNKNILIKAYASFINFKHPKFVPFGLNMVDFLRKNQLLSLKILKFYDHYKKSVRLSFLGNYNAL